MSTKQVWATKNYKISISDCKSALIQILRIGRLLQNEKI